MEKRILIVRKYGGYGGIEHQIESISVGLQEKGWEVFFLSDQQSPLSEYLEAKGVRIYYSPFNTISTIARIICKICKENEIRLVQSHMLKESFYCRWAKVLMPSLKHVFRVHTYIDCAHISELKKKCYHAVSKATDFLVDRYISINEYNVQEMCGRTKISRSKIAVVHDAVRELEKPSQTCPYKNGSIAMIANFVDFKGHDVLLAGMKLLKEQGYSYVVHLIGSVPGYRTPYEDHRRLNVIKQTIQDYHLEEDVIVCGHSNNIAQAVAECGMIVLPSDSEGTPNVLLEGMLLEKIVIASAVGGVPEFVFDGITGFVHKPKDEADFAKALLRAYNTPEEELSEISKRAKELILREYSRQSVIQGLIIEYHCLGSFL